MPYRKRLERAREERYWMLRLVDEEVMGCAECGETTLGDNTKPTFVYITLKPQPNLPDKDEVDVWCERCFEKEEE